MSLGAPINYNSNPEVNWVFDGDISTPTIEQLLLQREEIMTFKNYDLTFKCIKEKIFAMHDTSSPLSSEEIQSYNEKYNTETSIETINKLKVNISKLYDQKIEIDKKIENCLVKYKDFLESINVIVEKMNVFSDFTEEDDHFTKILTDRVEWYYKKFDIDSLMAQQRSINGEYTYLCGIIYKLSEITNPSICQICYTNQVAWYLNPCGHTLCEGCKDKMRSRHNCHYCRSNVNNFCKLYL
jgi:hypothetical protein